MTDNTITDIFSRLQRRLEEVETLLDNLDNAPGQMRATISRIAVEGRSVTNVLQNLRGKVENFNDWYQPHVDEMKNDTLLRFFYQLRTETLKQGKDSIRGLHLKPLPNSQIQLDGSKGIIVNKILDNGQIRTIFYPKPENTVSLFMGDSNGGSGFIIKTADGKEKKKYVFIPSDVIDISVLFQNPPVEHKGNKITDTTPRELCTLYVNYLMQLCEQATKKFNNKIFG